MYILIIMFMLIGSIIFFVGYYKFIPKKLYPFAIFISSISLLYSMSLITNHITGWDIQNEYYFSNIVLNNSYWDFTLPSRINAMLSVVIIVPVFQAISSIDIDYIFKIIYPLFFHWFLLGYTTFVNNKQIIKLHFSQFFCLFLSLFFI